MKIEVVFKKAILCFIFMFVAFAASSTNHYLNTQSGSIVYTGAAYTNNMNEVFFIDTGDDRTVYFDWSVYLDDPGDSLLIYNISSSGHETLLFTLNGGSGNSEYGLRTTVNSGKAKVVLKTNSTNSYADGGNNYESSGYAIGYGSASFMFNNDVTVTGNLTVGTSTASRLQVNGALRGFGSSGTLTVATDYGYLTMGTSQSMQNSFNFGSDKPYMRFLKPINVPSFYTSNGILSATLETAGNFTFEKNQRIKGYLSLANSTTSPITTYKGSLMIARPETGGQYINLTRTGATSQWSIGTVYNTSNFAIGQANTTDANFTNPYFVIDNAGRVGIGTSAPSLTTKLDVRGNIYINSGVDDNHIYWGSHNMTMGTPPDEYSHNHLSLKPGGSTSGELYSNFSMYHAYNKENIVEKVRLRTSGSSFILGGNLGIGMDNPAYLLDVKGTIRAAEVRVESLTQFADFVFDKEYALPKLSDVHGYILAKGHLPEIPSASEVKENGISLVDMQVKLLQKIEELTLYAIDQQKRIELLEQELKEVKNK